VTSLPQAHFLRGQGQLCIARFVFAALALCCAVLCARTQSAAQEVQLGRDITKLPPEVRRMREAILQAATSGDIEQLRIPIEMNEIQPVFSKTHVRDPIAYLKSASADGNGREMLAVLYDLLTTGYPITNPGTKEETFVWPYHAVIPLTGLSPSQEVEIYRFLTPARVKQMAAQGKYDFYRVEIGRDGVWHYFSSD
jgi:hypothetical protein